MSLPASAKYLVIGAGVHGLSTAWHLAKEQRARGEEPDVLILDKTGVGAGASGIACGVVRNNYYQPAMSRADGGQRRGLGAGPRGLLVPPGRIRRARRRASQVSDLTEVHERQAAHRLPVRPDRRRAEVSEHMRGMFPDWRAQGVEVCLHEHKGGFANNMASMHGLAAKAKEAGRPPGRRRPRHRASRWTTRARSRPSTPTRATSRSTR